ncbi:MAG: anhydro-N-acetylmuramic acid kinase [Bacteroidales bacterium]
MFILKIIGLMSGTSCDGLDIALCEFKHENNSFYYSILQTEFIPYLPNLRQRLLNSIYLSAQDVTILETDFSNFCAARVINFLNKYNLSADYISSHGHTVFHNPRYGYSYQIGNGEIIAKKTGIDCIYDFRSGDVALGGQGAPLVPIGDYLLFNNYDACLNLGGFANISKKWFDTRIAYDICPLNIVLNSLVFNLGLEYDDKGRIAATGKLINELFEALTNLHYYHQNPPKSLGKEWVTENITPIINKYLSHSLNDILYTYTIHAAMQITRNFDSNTNVLVTGGGAFNDFLIQQIERNTSANLIFPSTELIIFKEAVIFAFLGYLRVNNINNCLCSYTGAKRDSCCGSIAKA